ncbi:MAG TPA: methylmalonyl-CoA epimerase [Iamia sp.]|nr:methylmalonyl-CoA epimerase [Iamia sp.]
MSPLQARDPNESEDEKEAAQAGEELSVLTEIDHIGIAVRDLPAALDTYREAFGAVVEDREELADEGVEVALLKVAESYIQLLTPTHDDSELSAFLEERGEGIHHVGFRVDSVADVLEVLAAQGHELVDEEPRPGSRGTLVAFVHPRSMHGTLILLVEE